MEKNDEKVLWFFKKTHQIYNWFWKKKMLPLTKKGQKSFIKMQKYVIFAEEKSKKFAKDKSYRKVRDYCHYTGK